MRPPICLVWKMDTDCSGGSSINRIRGIGQQSQVVAVYERNVSYVVTNGFYLIALSLRRMHLWRPARPSSSRPPRRWRAARPSRDLRLVHFMPRRLAEISRMGLPMRPHTAKLCLNRIPWPITIVEHHSGGPGRCLSDVVTDVVRILRDSPSQIAQNRSKNGFWSILRRKK